MQRVIFLDIDGVLNDWERSWKPAENYDPQILPRCVQAFNRIIWYTHAKIVLSSSWRGLIVHGHMNLNGFAAMLRSHGVRGLLLDHTRMTDDEHRWQEIAAWLKEHPANGDRKYCIIDDDPDAFGGRPGILTQGGVGLTMEQADEAIAILGCEVPKAA